MKEKGEVWNLSHIMNGETYDSIIKKTEQNAEIIEKCRKSLSQKTPPSEILKIIKLMEETGILFSRVAGYYSLKSSENTKDEEALARLSALSMKEAEFESKTMFFQLWFIALDDTSALKFINSKELEVYRYYLKSVRDYKPYTKSEEIEKILSLKDVTGGSAFSSLYDIHTSSYKFDFNGKKNLTQEEVMAQVMGPNSKLREKAYETIYSKYKEDSVFLSEIYKNVVLDWSNEVVKIRGYKTPISARNMGNRIDDKSVEAFIKVIRKNSFLFAEYFKLKHEILKKSGQKFKFSRYHIYAPFQIKEKNYSYEESKKIVLETFKEFDTRFYDAAKKIFDERHIHSHPYAGKRGGAFCSTISNKINPYVMLNYTGKLNDVYTMMHELGHAVHSVFAAKQTDILSHAKIPLAETASIFAETVLAHKFIDKSKNNKEKTGLLINLIDSHYRSIPRQTYLVVFENWAHDNIKEGVTKKQMDEYYHSLLEEQFGEMELPEIFDHEWNYIPHIHHTPFYCYGYSWGHLLVLSLYAMYKEQGNKFISKYIEFLSAGSSASIPDIMKIVGADPRSEEFWQKGFDIIKSEIEELRKISNVK